MDILLVSAIIIGLGGFGCWVLAYIHDKNIKIAQDFPSDEFLKNMGFSLTYSRDPHNPTEYKAKYGLGYDLLFGRGILIRWLLENYQTADIDVALEIERRRKDNERLHAKIEEMNKKITTPKTVLYGGTGNTVAKPPEYTIVGVSEDKFKLTKPKKLPVKKAKKNGKR